MSNTLQPSATFATGGNSVPLVAGPASASASACTRKEPLPRLEPQLTREDWDHLLQERIGIMHEAGLTLARAQALALADTTRAHGQRPQAAI